MANSFFYGTAFVPGSSAINGGASNSEQSLWQAQSTQPWWDSVERNRQYFLLMFGSSLWPPPRFDRPHRQPVSHFSCVSKCHFEGCLLTPTNRIRLVAVSLVAPCLLPAVNPQVLYSCNFLQP